MPKTRASSLGAASKIATGTYTGDGAATQAITGVGFRPKLVIIYRPLDSGNTPGFKIDADTTSALYYRTALTSYIYQDDAIISLDADGFTVGDSTPIFINTFNVNAQVYTYTAWG